jgi:DNA-binding NarL/FixJ family response regulator
LLKPDVIILDLALPMLNGVETASVLKSELPGVKIIAFSMFAGELGRALAAATRIDAVMPKSSTLAALVATIEQLIASRVNPFESQRAKPRSSKPAQSS